MGSTYQRGKTWWIKYYASGRPIRESSHSAFERDARQLLRQREGRLAAGLPPPNLRLTVADAAADLLNDYRANGRRSLTHVERRLRLHVLPELGSRRACEIGPADCRLFIAKRQELGASNAEINRELAALRRSLKLAVEAGRLALAPHVPMLREDNVRRGFFEPEQIAAVLRHLPPELGQAVEMAHITGWRIKSEILRLTWRQVDFAAGIVRLEPGTTKNALGRTFPMTDRLRVVFEAIRASTGQLERSRGMIVPHVFHRDGNPIRDFRRAWQNACRLAGCPGMIPHDLRRTAIRDMVRAGIPERVAMQLSGHKTRSVFERYNIVSEADLRTASERLSVRARS